MIQIFRTKTVPIIRYGPMSQSAVLGGTANMTCAIDNAITLDWVKLSSPKEKVIIGSGSGIRFTELEPSDQGVFFCKGTGGGMFTDIIVESNPAILVLEGIVL